MKKNILFSLLAFLPLLTWAHDVKINGIFYNLNSETNEAEVTHETDFSDFYHDAVTIPSSITTDSGVEYRVTSIGISAFWGSPITSVTIPNSITVIKKKAFYTCNQLTSITIPNSVTYIGSLAFVCDIKWIYVMASNPPIIDIENGARPFSEHTAIYVPAPQLEAYRASWVADNFPSISEQIFANEGPEYEVDGIRYTIIDGGVQVVGYNSNVTNLELDGTVTINGILYNVVSIGYAAFQGCSGLTRVGDLLSCTNIYGYAFYNCNNLTSVGNLPTCTSIGQCAFCGCTSLAIFSNLSACKIIKWYAFGGCTSLERINLTAPYNIGIDFTGGFWAPNIAIYVPSSLLESYQSLSNIWPDCAEHFYAFEWQCSQPTISYEKGKIKCTCETEDVMYVYTITPSASSGESATGEICLSATFNVSVYAKREGYLDSEVATAIISLAEVGDMNGDGKLSVDDVTKLVDVIMGR